MSRFIVIWPAAADEVFASDAFDGSIGKPLRVVADGSHHGGMLIAARVAPDRRSVELTIEAGIDICLGGVTADDELREDPGRDG